MRHLQLLFTLVNVFIIFWILNLLSQRIKKYNKPYLRTLFHYTVFINLLFLGGLVAMYGATNLPGTFFKTIYPISIDFLYGLLSVMEIGLLVSMFRTVLAFNGRDISRQWKVLWLAVVVVLEFAYIMPALIPELHSLFAWVRFLNRYVFENILLLEIGFLVYLLIVSGRAHSLGERRLQRLFALLFLSRYLIPLLVLAVFLNVSMQETAQFVIGQATLLYVNLVPFLWLKVAFDPYIAMVHIPADSEQVLKRLFEIHDISNREEEIIRLMLKGLTNQDIASRLFISSHTVKNHIYKIFQKLGVNSRHQMVALLSEQGDGEA